MIVGGRDGGTRRAGSLMVMVMGVEYGAIHIREKERKEMGLSVKE